MSDAFIGEVRLLPYSFPPVNWAYCDGRQASVGQYQALFAVIGYTYGGSPQQQLFNFPNLRAMVPVGMGTGPGLTPRVLVPQAIGSNSVQLSVSNLPTHTHTVTAKVVGPAPAIANMTASPATTNDSWLSRAASITTSGSSTTNLPISNFTTGSSPDTTFPPQTVSPFVGGSNGTVVGHENHQPFLAMNFCICFYGAMFPVRN